MRVEKDNIIIDKTDLLMMFIILMIGVSIIIYLYGFDLGYIRATEFYNESYAGCIRIN